MLFVKRYAFIVLSTPFYFSIEHLIGQGVFLITPCGKNLFKGHLPRQTVTGVPQQPSFFPRRVQSNHYALLWASGVTGPSLKAGSPHYQL